MLGTAVVFSGVIGFWPGRSLPGDPLLVLASCKPLTSAECLGPHRLQLHLLCNGHKARYRFSFKKEEFRPHRTLNQSDSSGEQTDMQAVGRGTGKLQRKLEAPGLPPSRRRQCTGKNPTQKLHINTIHWKINLECCSELALSPPHTPSPPNVSVRGASSRDSGRFLKHIKIWCNSASHVEMHAF